MRMIILLLFIALSHVLIQPSRSIKRSWTNRAQFRGLFTWGTIGHWAAALVHIFCLVLVPVVLQPFSSFYLYQLQYPTGVCNPFWASVGLAEAVIILVLSTHKAGRKDNICSCVAGRLALVCQLDNSAVTKQKSTNSTDLVIPLKSAATW